MGLVCSSTSAFIISTPQPTPSESGAEPGTGPASSGCRRSTPCYASSPSAGRRSWNWVSIGVIGKRLSARAWFSTSARAELDGRVAGRARRSLLLEQQCAGAGRPLLALPARVGGTQDVVAASAVERLRQGAACNAGENRTTPRLSGPVTVAAATGKPGRGTSPAPPPTIASTAPGSRTPRRTPKSIPAEGTTRRARRSSPAGSTPSSFSAARRMGHAGHHRHAVPGRSAFSHQLASSWPRAAMPGRRRPASASRDAPVWATSNLQPKLSWRTGPCTLARGRWHHTSGRVNPVAASSSSVLRATVGHERTSGYTNRPRHRWMS